MVCPKQGWLSMRETGSSLDSGERFLLEQGKAVGAEARKQFPTGKMMLPHQRSIPNQLAKELDSAAQGQVFFEAEFLSDHCVARPDILRREGSGWHLIEVKSGTAPKKEYIEDVAYTLMVLEDIGLPVSKVSLMLLAPEYEIDQPSHLRFFEEDVTADAREAANRFRLEKKKLVDALLQDKQPRKNLIYACKNCSFYSDCFGDELTSPVFFLPGINERQFQRIVEQGYKEIPAVPDLLLNSPKQISTKQAVTHNKQVVHRQKLQEVLNEVQWPAYYLDFESCALAMPQVSRVRPYEQMPVQYSLHVFSAPNKLERHEEFLGNPGEDCRDSLCRQLLSQVGATGSIVVYSSFEKTILRSLGDRLPQHQSSLEALSERLFDLRRVFSEAVFHPSCQGKESIKHTLPAFTNLSYEDLSIQNGYQAIAEFQRMGQPGITADQVAKIRRDLLAYCKRDTLAMASLHFAMLNLA
jgi:predicted RecB family nuclease